MATAAVFLYTSPIYVALISRILFKEALTKNKILAILINIVGCIITVTGGDFSTMKLSIFGLIMGIVGLVAFGQGLSLMKVIGIVLVLCSIAVMNMTKKTA